MQFQSDISGVPVERPQVKEVTALGAAYLAGLAVGFWSSLDEILEMNQAEKVFKPKLLVSEREKMYKGWQKAVSRSFGWAK